MSLAAGQLRDRITLQKQVVTTSPYGETTTAWADIGTCWANVHPLSVREFMAPSSLQSQVSARVTIRYRDDVDATCRIAYRGKTYNIQGVLPDPDSGKEYLTLPVSEVTP